ncbi:MULTISPECIES: ribosome hibernation-promoting factor, HPF/YfiA family [unclassified Saccharopolyspora]|uniref:ribosome hibernation-promoting factor, HPF/YfiA family n=1 Tax=unclassified Saccharopolyspora TaxID=2646250 RepID=UPI001CD26A6E|nr:MULTISPECIES: ribosome-associated translation inhibitor RaiA [unclassified Saccharopolyspora]MCA1188686.1 ribosome-associated translation inhibitor RaiA [Saccharopolyspora sp. 6T]MCA1279249.1 ribosome-associated translation inhibitor RaiA [Saccharopolyspora sp. 7B]
MDIVVKGRNVEVPEHYREHIAEKLTRLERYDRKTIRADVELFHERNPRQAKSCQRVEITLKSRGPAVRAEACAGDFYAALDSATSKLENRLRRMHDRRKVHYGRHKSTSVAEATSANTSQTVAAAGSSAVGLLEAPAEEAVEAAVDIDLPAGTGATGTGRGVPQPRGSSDDGYEPGRIVREKEHTATPMTVDQALYEMELVGHDFYLFSDADTGCASVVYRRRGFDYGVIRLAG